MAVPEITEARRQRRWVAPLAIFGVAFALRMAVAVCLPGIHYPDEIFQSLEQAHRAVFGYGLVPWEFRSGARSWLLPGMLAAPMWLGGLLAPDTDAYRYLAQALVAALSSSTVVLGFLWGLRVGRGPAVLAALVLAAWFELVYFGARAFSEVVASAFLFAGVFLCSARTGTQETRRVLVAGLCLGAAFAFRFHLAPALALAAWWRCRGDLRHGWAPMLAGAAIPLLVLGLTDWATWSVPFGSIVNSFAANILEGRSHLYGTSPAHWYAAQLVERWRGALPVIGVLAVWGARRQPLPLLVALAILLAHSAVAHKEYRFIYPAIPLTLLSAALGSAELCRWLAARRHETAAPVGLLAAWSWTGGYTALHRHLPIHLLGWDPRTWDTRAFDAWILPRGSPQPAAFGYRLVRCAVQDAAGVDQLCLWARAGGCERGAPTTAAQRVLEATGQ